MLDKSSLEAGIAATFKANISNITPAQEQEVNAMAKALAGHIDTYVKGISINYTAGLTTPSGGGPVTGVMQHTVS